MNATRGSLTLLASVPFRTLVLAASALLASLTLACNRGGDGNIEDAELPPPAQRVENEALDLALARVPAGLALRDNGANIRLVPSGGDAGDQSELRIEVGPDSAFGIDPVQLANDQQASFGEAAGGEFFGAQKLVTPLGPATYARGRFDAEDGSRIEETRAYAVHPAANRLVTVTYRYPAGEDSRERVAQLLEVLGEIEPRTAPVEIPDASPPADEPGA
ncbi:MAG TPA: hypothetical protein VNB06_20060 [Thermoanaerobaculia bacterium]|nr:hypothetical protein [Thermoanaerobaculia bacterium]